MSIVIARIGKPHGIRGEVTVQTHTDDPVGRYVPGAIYATEAASGTGVPRSLTIASARLHQKTWLLGFEEIPDRTGAESLRLAGMRLMVMRSPVSPSIFVAAGGISSPLAAPTLMPAASSAAMMASMP